jgi:hypothetical protein
MKVTEGADAGKRNDLFATHPTSAARRDELLAMAGNKGGDKGEDRFRKAIAPLRLGWLLDEVKRGQYEESLVLFNRMLRDDGDDAEVLFARGDFKHAAGRLHEPDRPPAAGRTRAPRYSVGAFRRPPRTEAPGAIRSDTRHEEARRDRADGRATRAAGGRGAGRMASPLVGFEPLWVAINGFNPLKAGGPGSTPRVDAWISVVTLLDEPGTAPRRDSRLRAASLGNPW